MMKRLLVLASVLPLMAGSALGQDAEPVDPSNPIIGNEAPGPDGPDTAASALDAVKQSQRSAELLSSWVLKTTVVSPEGEAIGNIEEILIDENEGSISGVVLSVGGFLGFGSKSIAVDWNELEIDYDANEITASITRADADTAPEYAFRDRKQPPLPEPATDMTGTGGIGSATTPPPPDAY